MRILWASSSVGKGHLVRDNAIARELQRMADIEVDWLVPDPGGDFFRSKGHRVLDYSGCLSGSGKAYAEVFSCCTENFNLLKYIRADTRLHKHDFFVSKKAWEEKTYDAVVGDEAFWLLTGFASRWAKKPAPFIFLTDFIGVKSMEPGLSDSLFAWYNNLKFSMSFLGPDVYLYIGAKGEIPDERMGFLLPRRRSWALCHCHFVRPVVDFDPAAFSDKAAVRKSLGLPLDKTLFLAITGSEGDSLKRTRAFEEIFELLRIDYPAAHYIMVAPQGGRKDWIHYHRYLDELFRYFAVSDFVLTQSGYGKVAELFALGVPFMAIPLDFHFEQEYVMAHRLEHHGTGKIVTLRNNSPQSIARMISSLLKWQARKVSTDNGTEVARIILEVIG